MATEAAIPTPTAQVVGNAFVEQYYQILHSSPESVHRFYQDSSALSRPELNGLVSTVTTLHGINQKICSFDYKKYTVEIKTADAQDSHKDGVIVVVTGTLTGTDNVQKSFTQTFFLAPQDKGYFVLNDVFRFVETSVLPSETSKVTTAFAPPALKPEGVQNVEQRVHNQLPNERDIVGKKDTVVAPELQSKQNHISEATELSAPIPQHISEATELSAPIPQADAPKKSYASILASQSKKVVPPSVKVYMPTSAAKAPPKKVENKSAATPATEGYSIYVRNLPLNVEASEVEEEFQKFGPIKPGGVQVRNNKPQGSCFGFVEFQSPNSMNDAIKASPVTIKGWKAAVEMKRTTTRVGNGARFSPGGGRGGYQNDGFRGRENYGNGRGYARNDFTKRGDYSDRGRGQGGRSGQAYQQGRGQGESNRIADSN